MGVGLLDSQREIDRELEKMGGGGVDRCRCCEHLCGSADFSVSCSICLHSYHVLQTTFLSSSFFSEAGSLGDLCGAPVPLCIHWKISSLHKNCLKNEICDYILFISGLR